MSATLHLERPLAETEVLECEEVRVLGNVIWAIPVEHDREFVVPLENVLGVEGEAVKQHVEELPSPGGRYTELVTDVS